MGNSNWCPLWSEILESSLWAYRGNNPSHLAVKAVWVALLAAKNRDGIVTMSFPTLYQICGISKEEAEAVLEYLKAPDPESRNSAHDGRRIEDWVEEGGGKRGWKILNHEYYREQVALVMRRERQRKWTRNKRGMLAAGVGSKAERNFVNAEGGENA